ncbi:MAG: hypothetical protein NUV46_02625 [Nanoarchaeota archaeon]|nr:hypothetical protein [Nanoarchaeota archaeon]
MDKEKYDEIMDEFERINKDMEILTKKDSYSPVERIYRHEVVNVITQISALKRLIRFSQEDGNFEEGKNYKEEYEKKMSSALPKLHSLEKILKLSNFSEEELRKGQTNFYNLFMEEKEFYLDYLKNSSITPKIIGLNKEVNLNPSASKALVSTLYGNSIKWAPRDTEIGAIVMSDEHTLKINIENEFGEEEVRKDIGMGKKIGTEYVNTFVKNLNGTVENYQIPILSTKEKVYGVKIRIPLKKG